MNNWIIQVIKAFKNINVKNLDKTYTRNKEPYQINALFKQEWALIWNDNNYVGVLNLAQATKHFSVTM